VGHDHAGHHHTPSDPTCPYAQSAGPAPLPTLPTIEPSYLTIVSAPPTRIAQVHAHFGPIRQQAPRGPPLSA
jgi:hypothetical protein